MTENCTPFNARAVEPVALVTVTVWRALVWPTVTEPKLVTAGVRLREPGGLPLPVSETTAGRTPAEVELMVRTPLRLPVVEGVKTTPVVQLEAVQPEFEQTGAGRMGPHWLAERAKSPLS